MGSWGPGYYGPLGSRISWAPGVPDIMGSRGPRYHGPWCPGYHGPWGPNTARVFRFVLNSMGLLEILLLGPLDPRPGIPPVNVLYLLDAHSVVSVYS